MKANLSKISGAMELALRPILQDLGVQIQILENESSHQAVVHFFCLDGSSDKATSVELALHSKNNTTTINILIVNGASAIAQAKQLVLSANWILTAWPVSPDWLGLMLKQAGQQVIHPIVQSDDKKALIDASHQSEIAKRLAFALNASGLFEFEYDLASGIRFPGSREALVIDHSPDNFSAALAVVHPDDRPRLNEAYQLCVSTGCRFKIEIRALLRGESYRWIRSEGAVVDRSDRHPGRLIGVSWDIHNERDAKELAEQAKQRLDLAMRTAGMLSWQWDVRTSRRRLLSHDFDFLATTGAGDIFLDDLIHPDDLRNDLIRFEHALTHAQRYLSEVRIHLAGQPIRWLQLSGDPKLSATGEVIEMSGLGLDVTERHTMNEDLLDARALLFDSLEAGRMYCWEWNLVDNSRRTIGPSRSILGTTSTSMDAAQAMVHPEDIMLDEELLAIAIENNTPYQNEFRIIRPDGEIRWIQSQGNPIADIDGKVSRLSGVAVDVTERRQAELQLEGARKTIDLAFDAAKLNPWHFDLLGNDHSSGPRVAELFGEPIDSIEHFQSMIVAEDRGLFLALRDHDFLVSGNAIHIEFRVRLADGTVRWIACHAKGVCDVNGVPVQLVGVSYDVSEARHAQEKLARSLTQLERVQSATNVMLWDWSRTSGARCYQTGGLELSGAELPKIHPEDRRRVLRRLLKCSATGETFDEEFRLDNGTAEYSWVTMQGGRTSLQSKNAPAILSGVMIDISSRKRAAKLLMVAEEQLRRALDAAKMVCWEWRVEELSQSGTPILDYTPNITASTARAGGEVHPDDRKHHRQNIRDALLGRTKDYRCEFRMLRPDGTVTWLLSIGSCLRDTDGLVIGLVGVAIDITAQKNMEQALQESREWQRMAVAAGELNLWRVDIATGVRQGGALDQRLFGFSPSELGQVENMIHKDDRERVDLAWNMSINNDAPYDLDYRIVLPDNTVRWLRVRGKCIRDSSNKQPEMVGATMDITDQVFAELELRQALQAARAASEAKSAFLSSVSHELRTPLNGVIGFSELLMSTELDSTQHSHVHALNSSAHQLYGLINDVLDFSRIEAGEMSIEQTPFDLLECLEASMDMVASIADDKGLCLLMTYLGDAHRPVIGDPMRIRQIAANLLSNATKFTEKGMVSLELETNIANERLSLTLRVRDTGVGMSTAVLSKLFQPFRQGDVSTTRQFGGTGLGLSISKRLVDLMQGSIDVSSVPGEGSCFEVKINLALAASDREKPSQFTDKRIGISLHPTAMQTGLIKQIKEFGADAEFIEPGALLHRLNLGDPMDAIIVGLPMLDALAKVTHWPKRYDGIAVPVIVLVGIDQPLRPWLGAHGEKYLPIVRTIKPRQLYRALSELIKTDDWQSIANDLMPAPAVSCNIEDKFQNANIRILLAEDNEINQTLLLLQLESLGLTAMLANNGQEVLEALKTQSYDIILMDVEMPLMDGMEAASRIRNDAAFENGSPYIIAITAHVLGDSRGRFLASGMDDFISKPVIMDSLSTALERAWEIIKIRRQEQTQEQEQAQ